MVSVGAVLELLFRAYKNTIAEFVPFSTNLTGLDHSAARILSVAVVLEAVATVAYSGSVPAGIVFICVH